LYIVLAVGVAEELFITPKQIEDHGTGNSVAVWVEAARVILPILITTSCGARPRSRLSGSWSTVVSAKPKRHRLIIKSYLSLAVSCHIQSSKLGNDEDGIGVIADPAHGSPTGIINQIKPR
jgi:hypothetical protein